MVQPRQLTLPTQRDPVARLALVGLVAVACWIALSAPSMPEAAQAAVFATPTIGIVPTQASTEAPVLTSAPAAAPTLAPPPTPEPQPTVAPQVLYVEVTAIPTEAPPTEPPAPSATPLPAGSIIILPSPTQTAQEFIDSFGPTADPNATCQFTGCLHQP